MKVWIDGEFFDKQDAKISVFDHGLLYGDGIFEGIRCYNAKIFRLSEHIDRLYNSAKAIGLKIPYTQTQLASIVNECALNHEKKDSYIRLIITRGMGNLGLNPASCPKPTVIIITGDIQLYPAEFYEKGIDVVVSTYRRPKADMLNPQVKSLNYLNNVLSRMEADKSGAHESLILNHDGLVCECSGDNIFIVKKGMLVTPPVWCGALDGITRAVVLELATESGIIAQEKPMTLFDIISSDECFLTGTGAEIVPVRSVAGQLLSPSGPVTSLLRARFAEIV